MPESTSPALAWNVLSSRKPVFDLQLAEAWRYRDLVRMLIHRDFTATYKQTILGPLWFLLQPLFTTVMFTFVFGNIAKLPTDRLPPFVFYMSGVVVWGYFADCLTKTSQTFASNASVFGKVYFPRIVVPIASVITNLIAFGIQFSFFVAIAGWFYFHGAPIHPSWRIIILPVLVIQMAMLGIGVKVNTLPVVALGVGVGVDYGIYLFERMKHEAEESNLDLRAAFVEALRQRGTASVFTAVTMTLSVATWAFAALKFQADMGILLAFMFLVNLFGAVLLMPALAAWLVGDRLRPRGR